MYSWILAYFLKTRFEKLQKSFSFLHYLSGLGGDPQEGLGIYCVVAGLEQAKHSWPRCRHMPAFLP